jgi:hypothetical protein
LSQLQSQGRILRVLVHENPIVDLRLIQPAPIPEPTSKQEADTRIVFIRKQPVENQDGFGRGANPAQGDGILLQGSPVTRISLQVVSEDGKRLRVPTCIEERVDLGPEDLSRTSDHHRRRGGRRGSFSEDLLGR